MPAGLQVWDAAGTLVSSITHRLPRIIAAIRVEPQEEFTDRLVDIPGTWSLSGALLYYTYPDGSSQQCVGYLGTVSDSPAYAIANAFAKVVAGKLYLTVKRWNLDSINPVYAALDSAGGYVYIMASI